MCSPFPSTITNCWRACAHSFATNAPRTCCANAIACSRTYGSRHANWPGKRSFTDGGRLKNDHVAKLLNQFQGLEPVLSKMTAYFPGVSKGIDVRPHKTSNEADLAVVAGDTSGLKLRLLALDDSPEGAVSGEPAVLLGYPTGLAAILARAPEDAAHAIAASAAGD